MIETIMIGLVDALSNLIGMHELTASLVTLRLEIDTLHARVEVAQIGELLEMRGHDDCHVGLWVSLDAFEHVLTDGHTECQTFVVVGVAA